MRDRVGERARVKSIKIAPEKRGKCLVKADARDIYERQWEKKRKKEKRETNA